MYCPNCGKKVEGPARFCPACGTKLPIPEDAPQQSHSRQEQANDEKSGGSRFHQGSGESQEHSSGRKTKAEGHQTPTAAGGVMVTILKAAAGIFAAACVLQAILRLVAVIRGVFAMFGNPLYGIFLLLGRALALVGCVVMAFGLLVMVLCYDPEEDNAEPLLLTAAAGGLIRVIMVMFSAIVLWVGGCVTGYYYDGSRPVDVLWVLLYAVIVTAVLYGLSCAVGARPFAGKTKEDFIADLQGLPDYLTAEMENLSARFGRKKSQAKGQSQGQAQSQAQSQGQTQSQGQAQARGQAQGGEDVAGVVVMNEKRGLLRFVLLTIVTCGIYGLYEYHTIARDVNLACEGDGEHTAGFVKLFLLTLVTCGIYTLVWFYKFLNRIQGASHRYGFEIKTVGNMDLGICYIVLFLAGCFTSWLCGVGLILMLYNYYLVFRNLNSMAADYNIRTGVSGAASDEGK